LGKSGGPLSLSWSCHVDPLALWNKEAGKTRGDLKEGRTLRGKLSNVAGKEEEWKAEKLRKGKEPGKSDPVCTPEGEIAL